MRHPFWLPLLALVLASFSPGVARADERSLVILFGPTADDTVRQSAHFVADTAHEWLKSPGAAAELRRPGLTDGQELTRAMQSKDLEQALLDASSAGRAVDLQAFLNALDKAAYALARRPGKRLLLVILESPPPETVKAMKGGAEEFTSRIAQTVDFCRSKNARVVVVDLSPPQSKETEPDLKSLASATGGSLVREAKSLWTAVAMIVPVEKVETAASPAAATAPVGLPVHTRFIRMQPMRGKNVVTDMGPMTGFVLVECPMSALEFHTDGGKFLVQARITETVRNAEGKTVWDAKKDVTIKEAVKKQSTRREGNLYYMRELQLPGGKYTIEGAVDDLIASKSGKATETLQTSDSLPGFSVSDAVFVRPLNESSDRFDADQPFSYDGKALAPLLDPVFTAGESFTLRLYFVIYPDLRGAKPEMSLEIMRNGQAVGRSQLAFNDELKNTAAENGSLSGKGEQKHEFPYLAELRDASFDAGQYEARVTIRQGRNTVTRTTPFRVK